MNQDYNQISKHIIDAYTSEYSNVQFSDHLNHAYSGVYYVLSINDRRIQPLMLLHSCNLFGGEIKNALPAAYATELFYNFTLAHKSAMGRSIRNDTNIDTNSAIIGGDLIMILSFKYLAKTNSEHLKEIVQLFGQAAESSIKGQFLEIELELNDTTSTEEYLRMIGLKNAEQFAISMQIGATLAGANKKEQQIMYDFGKNLGIYLSLKEDIMANRHQESVANKFSIFDSTDIEDLIKEYYNKASDILAESNANKEQKDELLAFINSI